MGEVDREIAEGKQGSGKEKPAPRPDPRLESREKLGLKPDPELKSIVQEGEQGDSPSENIAEMPESSVAEE